MNHMDASSYKQTTLKKLKSMLHRRGSEYTEAYSYISVEVRSF